MAYNAAVDEFQDVEYPMLQGKTYLDHGGATIYAKSLVDSFATDLISNLYGNPHSACTPAKLSGQVVDDTRERTLRFFGADPEHFDLVFVANATAAIKLVMESFKDLGHAKTISNGEEEGFWYGYHVDAHNSIVGVRECSNNNQHCFGTDTDVEQWLSGETNLNHTNKLGLFAYPGQSNMTGRRLPLSWPGQLRRSTNASNTYSLLDAAALATTYPLDKVFSDVADAPDFTVLSFYKIFGYPDLGGLIVRKASGNILTQRKYFGGGTVSLVTVDSNPWHESREALHDCLEDGTLPFHNIIALGRAIETHERLYGAKPMETISKHTNFLGKRLYDAMSSLHHTNGVPVCKIYKDDSSIYGDSTTQGATMSFNIVLADGSYVPYTSAVERLANKRNIFVRSGQLCNPGGIATHLGFDRSHIQRLWSNGHRCGEAEKTGTEIFDGRPTGVVRVSLGAMTTMTNIDTLITFLREEFIVADVTTVLAISVKQAQRNSPATDLANGKSALLSSQELTSPSLAPPSRPDVDPTTTTPNLTNTECPTTKSGASSTTHFELFTASPPTYTKEAEFSVIPLHVFSGDDKALSRPSGHNAKRGLKNLWRWKSRSVKGKLKRRSVLHDASA